MTLLDTVCIELTNSCPLFCVHCSAKASPHGKSWLHPGTLLRCLSAVSPLEEIYLSGGEPFEHPDLPLIIRIASQVARLVAIYSSGTSRRGSEIDAVPGPLIDAVAAAGVSRIDVSIYAADRTEHERITTIPGSFQATLESAHRVVAAGIPLGVHFVAFEGAELHLAGVAALARELGAGRLHVMSLVSQGRAVRLAPVTLKSSFLEVLEQLLRSDSDLEVLLSSALRAALGHTGKTERDLRRTAMLDARGFLYPAEGRRQAQLRSRASIEQAEFQSLVEELASQAGTGR